MKKLISAILLLAMAASLLVSCGTPALVAVDADKIAAVQLTQAPDAEVDAKAFADAYNAAKVTGSAKEGYNSDKDVILFVFEDKKNVTLFYLDDSKFAVTGSDIKKAYEVELEMTIKGRDDEDDSEMEAAVVKIGGKWYLVSYSEYEDEVYARFVVDSLVG